MGGCVCVWMCVCWFIVVGWMGDDDSVVRGAPHIHTRIHTRIHTHVHTHTPTHTHRHTHTYTHTHTHTHSASYTYTLHPHIARIPAAGDEGNGGAPSDEAAAVATEGGQVVTPWEVEGDQEIDYDKLVKTFGSMRITEVGGG